MTLKNKFFLATIGLSALGLSAVIQIGQHLGERNEDHIKAAQQLINPDEKIYKYTVSSDYSAIIDKWDENNPGFPMLIDLQDCLDFSQADQKGYSNSNLVSSPRQANS